VIQYRQLANVAGVQQEVNLVKDGRQRWRQAEAALGQVGVSDESEA
jgi:hypothetical protein